MSLGFYFDNTRCTGCRVCQIACKDRLDLQKAGPRTRRADTYEMGTFPDAAIYHMSISCNHCSSPKCVKSCPVRGMYISDDGTVQHNDNSCIKCEACIGVCPYGAPQYAKELDLIIKCDSCKPLRQLGMKPVCVDACPMRALDFGEMDELKAKYGSNLGGNGLDNEAACLPSASQTNPNLLMKVKPITKRKDYRKVSL